MRNLSYFLLPFLFVLLLFSCNSSTSTNGTVDSTHKETDTTVAPQKIAVANNNVNIDYTDNWRGDTTLLFIHGWGINKTYWTDQVTFFGPKYRVVTMDLPGFGTSGKNRTDWSIPAYVSDVQTLIKKLHLKKVILVGHSMAERIILQTAITMPDQVVGIIGVDNFKGVSEKWTPSSKKGYDAFIEKMHHHFLPMATAFFNQSLFASTTPAAIKQRILNDVAHDDTVAALGAMQADSGDEVEGLKKLNKKLVLVDSDYQPIDSAAFTKNNIAYKIFIVHATGHYPMIEKPDEFNARLQQAIYEF